MSNLARAVELIEKTAESDAAARRSPAFREALNKALGEAYPPIDKAYAEEHPGLAARGRPSDDDREMMALRYGLFYAATMAYPEEAPDVVVRRWLGTE